MYKNILRFSLHSTEILFHSLSLWNEHIFLPIVGAFLLQPNVCLSVPKVGPTNLQVSCEEIATFAIIIIDRRFRKCYQNFK